MLANQPIKISIPKGSIKSAETVSLEAVGSYISIPKGSIKRDIPLPPLNPCIIFQFQKVRLKENEVVFIPDQFFYFNSKRFD